jgi:glycosyltransferase involved in cell wall biosynthesis
MPVTDPTRRATRVTLSVEQGALAFALESAAHAEEAVANLEGTTHLVGRGPPHLSVVVPAYRDGAKIQGSLERLQRALDTTGMTWEIVVVVDGDRLTAQYAQRARSSRVHVFGYQQNRGKGFALRYGMTKARGELVTMIDSDMEIAPEEIGRMTRLLDLYGADMVVGSKRHPLSEVHYPPFRRFQSVCYQVLVRLLFRVNLRDTQTGLKVMRREVADRVIQVALVKRFAFDLELVVLAHRFGFRRIIEAPVRIEYGFSSTTNFRAALRVVWDTLAIFYRMRLRHWYDRRNGQGVAALSASLPEPIDQVMAD